MSFETTYRKLPEIFFQNTSPAPIQKPEIFIWNEDLYKDLGHPLDTVCDPEDFEKKALILSGQKFIPSTEPLAQAYAGHQFGQFNRLGDGRAHLLTEWVTPEYSKWPGKRFDIQLKGSGPTVFSRRGDGRAALGPMLREYIISEFMAALGIPTTRSLCLTTTGEKIYREKELTGAILTRIAESHIRVGTFEYAAAFDYSTARQNQSKINADTFVNLKSLFEYTLERHFPEINNDPSLSISEKSLKFLEAVVRRQARLVSQWMGVGFIHGVMNTDNMLISGETIDYGPCAFIDRYDVDAVFSSIDSQGRYAYGRQPTMAQWNLARLADTLLPLIDEDESKATALAEKTLGVFVDEFQNHYTNLMAQKLGFDTTLKSVHPEFINSVLNIFQEQKLDYTSTFRTLSKSLSAESAFEIPENLKVLHLVWTTELKNHGLHDKKATAERMNALNPAFIPRNYVIEALIKDAEETLHPTAIFKFLEQLSSVYKETEANQMYQEVNPHHADQFMTFCGT